MNTWFTGVAAGWVSYGAEPLQYLFLYQTDPGQPPVIAGDFSPSPAASLQLPAGLPAQGFRVTILLRVRNAYGAESNTTAAVVVNWPPAVSADTVAGAVAVAASVLSRGYPGATLARAPAPPPPPPRPPRAQAKPRSCIAAARPRRCHSLSLPHAIPAHPAAP
jgi:hypothetical protein